MVGCAVASTFTWFDVVVFTPQPERISGEQYGIHADVWSVGISFMEVGWSLYFFFFFILNIAFSFGQNRIRCMPVCSSWMTTCVSKEAFNFSVPFLLSCLPTDIIDFPSVSDYKCLSAAQQMMQASASALFVNSVWYYYNYNSYGWLGVRIIDMVFSWWRWTSIALVPVGLVTLSLAVDMYI